MGLREHGLILQQLDERFYLCVQSLSLINRHFIITICSKQGALQNFDRDRLGLSTRHTKIICQINYHSTFPFLSPCLPLPSTFPSPKSWLFPPYPNRRPQYSQSIIISKVSEAMLCLGDESDELVLFLISTNSQTRTRIISLQTRLLCTNTTMVTIRISTRTLSPMSMPQQSMPSFLVCRPSTMPSAMIAMVRAMIRIRLLLHQFLLILLQKQLQLQCVFSQCRKRICCLHFLHLSWEKSSSFFIDSSFQRMQRSRHV